MSLPRTRTPRAQAAPPPPPPPPQQHAPAAAAFSARSATRSTTSAKARRCRRQAARQSVVVLLVGTMSAASAARSTAGDRRLEGQGIREPGHRRRSSTASACTSSRSQPVAQSTTRPAARRTPARSSTRRPTRATRPRRGRPARAVTIQSSAPTSRSSSRRAASLALPRRGKGASPAERSSRRSRRAGGCERHAQLAQHRAEVHLGASAFTVGRVPVQIDVYAELNGAAGRRRRCRRRPSPWAQVESGRAWRSLGAAGTAQGADRRLESHVLAAWQFGGANGRCAAISPKIILSVWRVVLLEVKLGDRRRPLWRRGGRDPDERPARPAARRDAGTFERRRRCATSSAMAAGGVRCRRADACWRRGVRASNAAIGIGIEDAPHLRARCAARRRPGRRRSADRRRSRLRRGRSAARGA